MKNVTWDEIENNNETKVVSELTENEKNEIAGGPKTKSWRGTRGSRRNVGCRPSGSYCGR